MSSGDFRAMLDLDGNALHALIAKYDRPGPRYTSYPTAPQFTTEVSAAEYRAALRDLDASAAFTLYVHVPFCEERCRYCGCFVVPTRHRDVAVRYVRSIAWEMALVGEAVGRRPAARGLHLGGGTPTYLTPGELEDLFAATRREFDLGAAAEISVELDPRVTTAAHLETMRAGGVTRVSLGVQDTSPEVQEAIGRHQTAEQTRRCFEQCRELRFEGINVDLVYGLPRQTRERFAKTLDDILALRPDRLAIYGYAHVPWIRPHQRSIAAETLPSAAERLELHLLAHERLTGGGYRHIGMDHFALEGDELARSQERGTLGRSFMGYTPYRDALVLGFGVSSIGDLGSGYFQNEKKLARYYEALDRGELPVERGLLCTPDDRARRSVILDVLCNLAIDGAAFEERVGTAFSEYFADEVEDLARLEKDGLVECDLPDGGPARVQVTPRGRLFLRNIAMVFDRSLRRPAPGFKYSRTV